ncbi:MAG: hypothetical protein V1691_04460 [Chloroflexota bacterium]
MNIELLRDIALVVFSVGATVAIIFIAVIALLLYLKLSPILDSFKANARAMENISHCVEEEIAKPLAQLAAFIQGIRQAASLVNKFSKRKGGKND